MSYGYKIALVVGGLFLFFTIVNPQIARMAREKNISNCDDGIIEYNEGRTSRAIDIYRSCLKSTLLSEEERATVSNNLAMALGKVGNYEAGINILSEALNKWGWDETRLANRGYLYMSQGQYSSAVSDFSNVLVMNNNNIMSKVNLGFSYCRLGNSQKAADHLLPIYSQNAQGIQVFQKILQDARFYVGKIDGQFGPQTLSAASRFFQNGCPISVPNP